MPMRQGRASEVVDRGDGTVLRSGGRPEAEAAIMAAFRLADPHVTKAERRRAARADPR